jgi:hypothetical protein
MCTPRGSLSTVQAKYVQALDSERERERVHLMDPNAIKGSRGGIHEHFFWRRVDSRSLRSTLSYKSTLIEFTDNLPKPPDFFSIQTVTKDDGLVFIK